MHTNAIWTTIAKVYIYFLPCFNISKQSKHCSWQHVVKARITKMLTFQREVLRGYIGHSRKLTAFVQHGKLMFSWKVGVNKTFFMKLKSKKKINITFWPITSTGCRHVAKRMSCSRGCIGSQSHGSAHTRNHRQLTASSRFLFLGT